MGITLPPLRSNFYNRPANAIYGQNSAFLATRDKALNSYKENKAPNTPSNTGISKDSARKLVDIESSAIKLRDSADKFLNNKPLFESNDIYDTIKDFTKSYNEALKEAGSSSSEAVRSKASSLSYLTKKNSEALDDIGISIGGDNSLSVDDDKLLSSDREKLKGLFGGVGSYAYSVSAQSAMINYQANLEAAKAGTYTSGGTYGSVSNSGSIYDRYL